MEYLRNSKEQRSRESLVMRNLLEFLVFDNFNGASIANHLMWY